MSTEPENASGSLVEDFNISPQIVSGLTQFSASLFQVVGKKLGADENIFISPPSVAAVLSSVTIGAKGKTSTQVKSGIRINGLSDEQLIEEMGKLLQQIGKDDETLVAASQLHVDKIYDLKEPFKFALKRHYGIDAQNSNFGSGAEGSRGTINQNVMESTQHKIKDILPPGSIDTVTSLILISAVYFKGRWAKIFDSSRTVPKPFFLGSSQKKIDASMMHIDGSFRTGALEELNAKAIEIPYEGGKLSMFILLPDAVDGLPVLESKMTPGTMEKIDQRLKETESITLAVPQFKIDPAAGIGMKEMLEVDLGMEYLFNYRLADLSGISGGKGLYCSNLFHKTFIQVEEGGTGTSAAAATGETTGNTGNESSITQAFTVDHPAVFFIRDNRTKLILFVGRLAQPSISKVAAGKTKSKSSSKSETKNSSGTKTDCGKCALQ